MLCILNVPQCTKDVQCGCDMIEPLLQIFIESLKQLHFVFSFVVNDTMWLQHPAEGSVIVKLSHFCYNYITLLLHIHIHLCWILRQVD
jgi:hypothetical protein